MTSAQAFHPLTLPISDTNLIEASAGTGKTYGIAALFARLILLEQMPVETVLVVTFTNAATAELKTRLRTRLTEMLVALEKTPAAAEQPEALAAYCQEHHADDVFLPQLLQEALQKEPHARLILRLKAALSQFDNASIYTIHGFCQRILRDYAFLCETPFDIELTDNHDRLLLDAAQDFWRSRVAPDPQLAQLVFEQKLTPQALLAQFRSYLSADKLDFRRPDTDLAAAQSAAWACWQSVQADLPHIRATFWEIYDRLNKRSYNQATFEGIFNRLAQAAEQRQLPQENLEKFSREALLKGLNKNQALPDNILQTLSPLERLHHLLSALAVSREPALIALQIDFITHLRHTLAEQKRHRRERTFDDLLTDVHHALTHLPGSPALAATLAGNWQAALIDEFQDTDPLQYGIFERIFVDHGKPLFLVGDPKQAIYRFRGADIRAYLQAADKAQRHYTLTRNFRSHAALVNSINHLFAQKTRPFILDIPYPEVDAARAESRLQPPQAAFAVRWLNQSPNEDPNQDTLRKRSADYCADEIAGLLNQGAAGRLKYEKNNRSRPLGPGDIAVLVRDNLQAELIAKALKKRRIQSVMVKKQSVFHTDEAEALASLLGWWLEAYRTEPLRFVLAGPLFNRSAEDLRLLNENETILNGYIQAAEAAVAIWQAHGIYAALQHFSGRYGLETGLLESGNERSLTNYLQLAELLAVEEERGLSPAALLQWLDTQIQTASTNEENTLRLESDEALVKIITMHAAKGLQYPVVFCPFLWDSKKPEAKAWQTLPADNGNLLLASSQLEDHHKQQITDEQIGEELRLLYVALTRAEEQLIVYTAGWSSRKSGATVYNPLAFLLEGTPETLPAETIAAYQAEKAAVPAMLHRNWQRLLDSAPADTSFEWSEQAPEPAVYTPSADTPAPQYRARTFAPRTFEFIRHTSFTSLTRAISGSNALSDEWQNLIDPAEGTPDPLAPVAADAPETDAATDKETASALAAFPRGTQAGICLHNMLEHFDFRRPAAEQHDIIADSLARHGYEADLLPVASDMLDTVAATPLNPQGCTAARLPATRRLAEMGFVMHTRAFSVERVRRALAEAGLNDRCLEAAAALDFETVAGFLNGFIDLTALTAPGEVCIIDYKSNYLGAQTADYNAEALDEAVAHHHYYLQAWIYAVAAARYLNTRGYPLETVRIRYLFLRGLNGDGSSGIWQWDIPVRSLAEWLETENGTR